MRQYKRSKEWRDKISKSLKGNKCALGAVRSTETRRKMAVSKIGNKSRIGMFHTQETKIKMREIAIRNGNKPPIPPNEKRWNWRGGISSENMRIRNSTEYRLWRTAVYQRDNYTCIWCGNNKGGNLQADHIKPFATFPALRFAIDNGRTLCRDCHKKTDTYGYKSRNQ